MVRREFFCPACNVSLQKSDAMMALAEIRGAGGSYMTSVDQITCPACGAKMSVEDVAAGKFDYRKGAFTGCIAGLIIIGLIVFGVNQCSGG